MPKDHFGSDILDEVLGEELNEVIFVMDYVELGFNGPKLTAYTLPEVKVRDLTFRSGEPGWRDALCSCITKRLEKVSFIPLQEIGLEFEHGTIITISLKPESYCGPEAVMFSMGAGGQWMVW